MADIKIINKTGNIGNIRPFGVRTVDVSGQVDTTALAGVADIVPVFIELVGIVNIRAVIDIAADAVVVVIVEFVKRSDVVTVTDIVAVGVFLVGIIYHLTIIVSVYGTVHINIEGSNPVPGSFDHIIASLSHAFPGQPDRFVHR